MANGVFEAVLPQSAGYGIILGGGFGFAVFMLILSMLQSRFAETSPFESKIWLLDVKPFFLTITTSAEEFSSASRSVKPGLVCTGIVCHCREEARCALTVAARSQLGHGALH